AQDGEAFKETVDAAQDVEASKDLSNPNDATLTESFDKDVSGNDDESEKTVVEEQTMIDVDALETDEDPQSK
ncbi:hypothetical protein A2U01_0072072, partial [Trifolium medium]|nr:hypothetical protein [Trifolium medium]